MALEEVGVAAPDGIDVVAAIWMVVGIGVALRVEDVFRFEGMVGINLGVEIVYPRWVLWYDGL